MKPRIVCNTGPLIALSLIHCQDILSQLYDPLIPRKVIEEWAAGEDTHPGMLPEDCEIVEVTVANPFLALQLDAGEASVIQAAIDFKIDTVRGARVNFRNQKAEGGRRKAIRVKLRRRTDSQGVVVPPLSLFSQSDFAEPATQGRTTLLWFPAAGQERIEGAAFRRLSLRVREQIPAAARQECHASLGA